MGKQRNRRLQEAAENWRAAREIVQSQDHGMTLKGAQLQLDQKLTALVIAAKEGIDPLVALALKADGYRHAMGAMLDGASHAVAQADALEDALEAAICETCQGDCEIVEGHINDPASAKPCPGCAILVS